MHLPTDHAALIWLVALASILLMLLRPWHIREAVWISAGALLLIVLRLIPLRFAMQAVASGSGVYLFLAGMMLLAEQARQEGVFDWIADIAVRRARNSTSRLFLLIYVAGIAVTSLLSNDATAVVLTPAILAAVRRARVQPKPYLLACALIANAASFLLPVSNPSNLVVYASHLPALGQWMRIFLLPSVASIVVTFICLRFLLRKAMAFPIATVEGRVTLSPAGRLALYGLLFAATVLLSASAFGIRLGLPTCAAAVASLLLVSLKDRGVLKQAARGISWSILPLVAGLFILVEAMNSAGLLPLIESAFQWCGRQPKLAGYLVSSAGTAFLSNAMNNLPVGLAAGTALKLTPHLSPAVLIGVNLGPNLSVTGSLATILWLIALRRGNVEISHWEFFKTGMIAMPAALLVSLLALWLTA
ncbi:MAG TPA: SLC13 family permease [Silvibacterium sp.]|nr:SLC13 family permease [Silvibacterium sp.]